MRKATEHFNFIYKGELVNDHTIDTNELGAALLSIGNVFTEANKLVGKEKAIVNTKVRALQQGSFDIQIIVESINVLDIFTHNTWNALQEIKTLLFGNAPNLNTGEKASFGIINIILALKGKTLQARTKLSIPDGHGGWIEYKPTRKEAKAIKNHKINTHLGRIVAPIKKEKMHKLLITDGNKEIVQIKKEEAEYFVSAQSSKELVHEYSWEDSLKIISVVFKETNKWKFESTDSGRIINACIKDEVFLTSINNHEVSFRKDDILICEVHTLQYEEEHNILDEHQIVKVKKHSSDLASQFNLTIEKN